MALIMIENLFNRTITVSDVSRSLLRHLQDHGIDWMHACGGKGRCTTCKVIIRNGHANFSAVTGPEKRYFAEGALKANERLACQAKISGDITILAPTEYQLPHMRYSDE
jgi:2Fe-2S ferredoxin